MSTSPSLGRSRTLLGRKTVRGSPWSGKEGRSESGLCPVPALPVYVPCLALSWAPQWEGCGDIGVARTGGGRVCDESCGCWAFDTGLALAVHVQKPRVSTGSTPPPPPPGLSLGPGTSFDPASSALRLLEPVLSCTGSRYRETEQVKLWGSLECLLGFLPEASARPHLPRGEAGCDCQVGTPHMALLRRRDTGQVALGNCLPSQGR